MDRVTARRLARQRQRRTNYGLHDMGMLAESMEESEQDRLEEFVENISDNGLTGVITLEHSPLVEGEPR